MLDEILKQLQPLIGTLIGLVLTWALGEAVRYLRAKGAAAAADGDVARATALDLAAHAAVAAAEELAKAAEKRGEGKMNGASKQSLAQSLMPAGVDATTAQRVVLAAVARTFGTGATGTQTVGRPPSVALAPSPATGKTGGVAALTLALAVSGCGTIIKGGKQDIEIRTPAPDAEVTVKSFKGRDVYQGPPGRVQLAREDSYTVTVTAPGYRERKVTITKSMSGWVFGNLIWVIPILWGVGVAVDAASGGLWTLGDDEVDVPLVRGPAPATAPAKAPEKPWVIPAPVPTSPPQPAEPSDTTGN